ncbi:MAG: MFS transporter [Kiritimatiellia bacterium]
MGKKALFLLAIAGCGGMLFDFGGTIIAPAIPYFEALGLFTADEISRLTAAVVLTAALASLAAGPLAERFGRKPSMLFAAALAAAACVPICCCHGDFRLFYAGRALQGVAAGLLGVIVPMYLAETLPAADRGKGAGVFQFMDVAGILFCSFVGFAVVKIVGPADSAAVSAAAKTVAWKTIFWSSAAPAVLFFVGALGLEESPVWLARRRTPAVRPPAAGPRPEDSLFRRKYVCPFVLAVVILACNQATGINSMQYYALKMFQDAGLSNAAANVGFMAFTGLMLAMTAVACAFVDRTGRKFLMKAGTAGIIGSHLAAAAVFLAINAGVLEPGPLAGWLVVGALLCFIAAFSLGPGVVVWLALSELMPNRIRANGMAIAMFVNMMVAYLIADRMLALVEKFGYAPVMIGFACATVVYFVAAAFFMPETKGKTLEEIEQFFEQPPRGEGSEHG